MTTPGRFAAAQFQRRQAKAAEAVQARAMSASQATEKLRPWLAIACQAGADLPELEEALAENRTFNLDHRPFHSEAELRTLLAIDICPRQRWAPMLAKARDRALDAADPDAAHWQALCAALHVHIPYQPPATERKTA